MKYILDTTEERLVKILQLLDHETTIGEDGMQISAFVEDLRKVKGIGDMDGAIGDIINGLRRMTLVLHDPTTPAMPVVAAVAQADGDPAPRAVYQHRPAKL